MAGVFISYRRDDTLWCAGRLFDRLSRTFGATRVFIDVESLHPAEHFSVALQRRVSSSDIVLVLIGPRWLATAGDGARRLDNPRDLVRAEVAAALALGKPIIPILVEPAVRPEPGDLPEDVRGICDCTFFELEHAKFPSDAERLIELVREKTAVDPAVPQRRLVPASIRRCSRSACLRCWTTMRCWRCRSSSWPDR
jgi:hypothetical protein